MMNERNQLDYKCMFYNKKFELSAEQQKTFCFYSLQYVEKFEKLLLVVNSQIYCASHIKTKNRLIRSSLCT